MLYAFTFKFLSHPFGISHAFVAIVSCISKMEVLSILNMKPGAVLFHGNTKISNANYSLSIGTLNVGGLSSIIKRKQMCDFSLAVCGITESHLTHDLHSRTSEVFPSYYCVFSPDQADRQFSGVSILLSKTAFWQITPIKWNPDDACYKYHQDCRLVAAQAWLGHGETSILFYVAYGPRESRWENHKRTYLNNMLDANTEDVISRGQIPAVLLCDLNMPISESSKIRAMIRSQTWNNASSLASHEHINTPTCHPGKRKDPRLISFSLPHLSTISYFNTKLPNLSHLKIILWFRYAAKSRHQFKLVAAFVHLVHYPICHCHKARIRL